MNRKLFQMLAIAGLPVLAVVMSATKGQAAVIAEDFAYDAPMDTSINGKSGGSGWSGSWVSGARPYIRVGSLSYADGGYAVTQADTSNGGSGGKLGIGFNDIRGARRDIAAIDGSVWFSFLLANNAPTNSVVSIGVQFNVSTSQDFFGTNYIQLNGTNLNINYGGTLSSAAVTGLAGSQTHLVVGRWTVGVGNDTLEVWVNPADLTSLGAANFTGSGVDALGDSLTRIGLIGRGTGTGANNAVAYVDALRLSNEQDTGFLDVTGVPEPASIALFVIGGLVLARRRDR